MPNISIRIDNLENLKAAFGSYPEIVAPMLRDASMKSAFEVERAAKILSPVDTGRLRASFQQTFFMRSMFMKERDECANVLS